jgi:hypothetical protein
MPALRPNAAGALPELRPCPEPHVFKDGMMTANCCVPPFLSPGKSANNNYTKLILDLWQFDAEKETAYISTLTAYLETNQSLEAAGRKLSVHRNPVAYRINRMKELYHAGFSNTYSELQNSFGWLLRTLGSYRL